MNFKGVKKATIIRTAILVLAIINSVLQLFGKNVIPVNDEQVSSLISNIWLYGSAIWAWWKNNSFTEAAQAADEAMQELKADEIGVDETAEELAE